jgi:hypothetical protein
MKANTTQNSQCYFQDVGIGEVFEYLDAKYMKCRNDDAFFAIRMEEPGIGDYYTVRRSTLVTTFGRLELVK